MQEAKTQDRKAQQDKCLLRATRFLARLAVVMCSAKSDGNGRDPVHSTLTLPLITTLPAQKCVT
jgi:hypothetical protein